jgi:hypothetical protein
LQLRYKSLHDFTASCHCVIGSLKIWWGTTGNNSFWSCKWLVYEIDGFIDEYRICPNFIIILTGGDTEFWLND